MLTHGEDVEAHALRSRGWTISAIARHLGRDRKTVRAYINGERVPGVRARSAPDPLEHPAGSCDRLALVDEHPVTRYARAPDRVSIAYQATGTGPPEILFISGFFVPFDLLREEPSFVRFAGRLGPFSRTVFYDS